MRPARDIYRSIERAEADLRAEEARVARRLAELAEEAAEIHRAESAAYRSLAQTRLDALERDKIAGRLDRAEREALTALETRKARLAEAERQSAALEAELADAMARRDAADQSLNEATEARDLLADATQARLVDDPDWAARAAALEAAEAKAEAADAKADRAEADRAEKSIAYDTDPLFAYLWARRYDTPDYRAMALVKEIDGRVARLIGYPAARRDYTRLNEIPRRLRAHADRLAETAEAAGLALAEIERAALESDGIGPHEEAVEAAEAALDGIEAEIARLETARETADTLRARLTDPEQDEGMLRALDGLAQTFRRTELSRLAERARATPSPEDDNAVARLAELAESDRRVRAAIAEAKREERDLARRRDELAAERRRFRSRGYARPGGRFDNGDALGTLIGGIVKGAARAALSEALEVSYRGPRSRRRAGFGGLRAPRSPAPAPRSTGGFRTGGGF